MSREPSSHPEPAPPSKRSKRDALIEAASAVFNTAGVSQTSLADISRRLGITRAALYYYAEDREDLLFQCYRAACETRARDLDAAARAAGSAHARLIAFVRRALDPTRPESAVLCEQALLPEDKRATIEALRQSNLARLIGLIEAGARDGSIRACDALVVAEAVEGMLAWAPMAPRWTGEDARDARANAMNGVIELLTHGIAIDPARAATAPRYDTALLRAPAGNPFDRDAAIAAKTEELLRAASRLFNRKGVDGASVDDIAAEIGATKGAVYHYLADKPQLVARCYHRAFDLSERVFEMTRAHNGDGLARALLGYRLLVEINADETFSPLAPFVGLDALKPADRADIVARIHRLETIYPQNAQGGVADGSIRDIALTDVALASAGAFGWLPKWIDGPHGRTRDAIVDEFITLFAIGLAPR